MWEGVYQSEMCCEFSELCTTPCQNLTVPHLQIGSLPIKYNVTMVQIKMKSVSQMPFEIFNVFISMPFWF